MPARGPARASRERSSPRQQPDSARRAERWRSRGRRVRLRRLLREALRDRRAVAIPIAPAGGSSGCSKPRRHACNACLAKPPMRGPRYCASPTSACPIDARCTRIWCVRPVSSLQTSNVQSPKRSRISYRVVADLPVLDHRHRRALDRMPSDWRVDGPAARDVAAGKRQVFAPDRSGACNCRTRSVCAVSVLATTSRPLVSLSRR